MITIANFSVGNREKSFYLDEFKSGVNIIHSDDNNKGKTIVSQGIMYALGNTAVFPAGFEDFKNYYFIVTLIKDSLNIIICRRDDFFVVNDGQIKTFDSVNEFKRYFSDNIISLPTINFNGISQLAGLELFIEMLFLPQDNRKTSDIFNKGRYSKEDYIEFIYSHMNCSKQIDPASIIEFTTELNRLSEQRKLLKKSSSILKSRKIEASFATYTASKVRIDEKIKGIEKTRDIITELTTLRNRLQNKIVKNEILLKEINSLNRDLDAGKLVCIDCGSNRIAYESKESAVRFEISDNDIRAQIRNIINQRIQAAKEDIQDVDIKLQRKRQELAELMRDDEVNIENLFFYKDKIVAASSLDAQIFEIDNKIAILKTKIENSTKASTEEINSKEKVYSQFIQFMNEFYSQAEPDDIITIDNIFTKKDVNYSGSQGALYLMARIYAASKLLKFDFPIYIDHFRGGELSTIKENKVIDLFKSLNKQVIFTCTLKKEETNKYLLAADINDISLDYVEKFHLLTPEYNTQFLNLLEKLSINLNIQ